MSDSWSSMAWPHLSGCKAGHCHFSRSWDPRYLLKTQIIIKSWLMWFLASRAQNVFWNQLMGILDPDRHPAPPRHSQHTSCSLWSHLSGIWRKYIMDKFVFVQETNYLSLVQNDLVCFLHFICLITGTVTSIKMSAGFPPWDKTRWSHEIQHRQYWSKYWKQEKVYTE